MSSENVDNDKNNGCMRTHHAILLLIAGLAVGGGAAGLAVGLVDIDDAPNPAPSPMAPTAPTAPPLFPTAAPQTAAPVTDEDAALLALFASVVGDDVYVPGTTANDAAEWMVFEDTRPRSDDDEENIQRYLLAFHYFATTKDGDWLSCGQSASDDVECVYLKPTTGGGYIEIPWIRWLSEADECEWAGVTCRTMEGSLRVTEIELAGQLLSGFLVTELLELPDLTSLAFPDNKMGGTIHASFGQHNLERLELTGNDFTGTIPADLLSSPVLEYLGLGNNIFSGTLPEFAYNTPLGYLNVGANDLSGTISLSASYALKLTGLYLFENRFTGELPQELGQLPLKQFQAQANRFEGSLPFTVSNVNWQETLEEVDLSRNSLQGTLPNVLGRFTRLGNLRLSSNALEGRIPVSVYNLVRLFRLELNDNNLEGVISPYLNQLSSLEVLDLSSNRLVGSLPSNSGVALSNLQSAQLQFNFLTGSIPFCGVKLLQADCLPASNPPTPCTCCTKCCNRETLECE